MKIRFDVIPGLALKSICPIGSTRSKHIACIGDETFMSANGKFDIPAKPVLHSPGTLEIKECSIVIPERKGLERDILSRINHNREHDDLDAIITSRILRIGKSVLTSILLKFYSFTL